MTTTNESGGTVHQVDIWTRLERFLILGDESGDYHVSAKELEVKNLDNVLRCWTSDPLRTRNMVVAMSTSRRAVKNNTCLAALAWGFIHPDPIERRLTADILPQVARTLSHLITFVDYVSRLRGWGRVLKRAVANWFQISEPERLGYQLVKYQNRKGWRSADLLRLAHPVPVDKAHDGAYFWATGGDPYEMRQDWYTALPEQIKAVTKLSELIQENNAGDIAKFAVAHQLPWEILPSELLGNVIFWLYFYRAMPDEAFLRNITRLAYMGVLNSGSLYVKGVIDKLRSAKAHPLQFLITHTMYSRGENAGRTWVINQQVLNVLEERFINSFSAQRPTGKRIVLAIDRSGSMRRSMVEHIPGLTSVGASAALAACILSTESNKVVLGFNSKTERFAELETFTSIRAYTAYLQGIAKGGTNCTSPIQYCIDNNVDPDAIIIITDAQHWDGPLPDQALAQLRARVGHPVKCVVICTTPNKWTVVCPNDPDTMNIVGFDSHALRLTREFIGADSDEWDNDVE